MNITVTYIFAGIILILLTWIIIYVTNKAYSRKWEDEDDTKDNS